MAASLPNSEPQDWFSMPPVPALPKRPLAIGLLEFGSRICLVGAFLLLLPVAALTLAQSSFGFHSYTLESTDMAPQLRAGSLVVTHPVQASDVQPGAVVAFHPPGKPNLLVTRRVISVSHGGSRNAAFLVTRAATSQRVDPWLIPGNAVIERVVLSLPEVGYPAAFVQTRVGRFLFLVLPAALLAALCLAEMATVQGVRRTRGLRASRAEASP